MPAIGLLLPVHHYQFISGYVPSMSTGIQQDNINNHTASIQKEKKKKESEIFLSSVPELSACFSFGLDGVFISQKLLNMRLIKISSRAFWCQQHPNSQFLFIIRASENRRSPYTLLQLGFLKSMFLTPMSFHLCWLGAATTSLLYQSLMPWAEWAMNSKWLAETFKK